MINLLFSFQIPFIVVTMKTGDDVKLHFVAPNRFLTPDCCVNTGKHWPRFNIVFIVQRFIQLKLFGSYVMEIIYRFIDGGNRIARKKSLISDRQSAKPIRIQEVTSSAEVR